MELLAPWRRRETWWALVHIVLNGVVGAVSFTVVFGLLALSAGLLITFFLAIPFIWALFVSARGLARAERSRFRALLGAEVADTVPPLPDEGWFSRFHARVRTRARWREIGFLLARGPIGLATMITAQVTWAATLALILLPLYVGALPGESAKFGLVEVGPGLGAVLIALGAVVGFVVVAPWVTLGVAHLDVSLTRRLLGVAARPDLEEQVTRLESSRVAAVDSAESERRRIERDLHDGAQQRLVAVAMGLGAARERLDDDPESSRRLLVDAHEEAKSALKDLRDLVRGVHPAILDDRGLDAALSSVVARTPLPVTLEVDLPERPPPVVESTAYFIVSEALTNVATHADATRASVAITRSGQHVVVEVHDNGVGGADPSGGTGLHGLAARANALGGALHVTSPAGGPTTVVAELPCAS